MGWPLLYERNGSNSTHSFFMKGKLPGILYAYICECKHPQENLELKTQNSEFLHDGYQIKRGAEWKRSNAVKTKMNF